jgi:hypothetical protein
LSEVWLLGFLRWLTYFHLSSVEWYRLSSMTICFFVSICYLCVIYILSTRPTCCIMVSMFLLWQMVFCTTQGGDWSSEAASHNWAAAKLGGYRDLAKRWQKIVLFVFKCSSRWTWPGDLFFLWDPRRSERSPYVFVVSGTSPFSLPKWEEFHHRFSNGWVHGTKESINPTNLPRTCLLRCQRHPRFSCHRKSWFAAGGQGFRCSSS